PDGESDVLVLLADRGRSAELPNVGLDDVYLRALHQMSSYGGPVGSGGHHVEVDERPSLLHRDVPDARADLEGARDRGASVLLASLVEVPDDELGDGADRLDRARLDAQLLRGLVQAV